MKDSFLNDEFVAVFTVGAYPCGRPKNATNNSYKIQKIHINNNFQNENSSEWIKKEEDETNDK